MIKSILEFVTNQWRYFKKCIQCAWWFSRLEWLISRFWTSKAPAGPCGEIPPNDRRWDEPCWAHVRFCYQVPITSIRHLHLRLFQKWFDTEIFLRSEADFSVWVDHTCQMQGIGFSRMRAALSGINSNPILMALLCLPKSSGMLSEVADDKADQSKLEEGIYLGCGKLFPEHVACKTSFFRKS